MGVLLGVLELQTAPASCGRTAWRRIVATELKTFVVGLIGRQGNKAQQIWNRV
jgi:hypothetical protein